MMPVDSFEDNFLHKHPPEYPNQCGATAHGGDKHAEDFNWCGLINLFIEGVDIAGSDPATWSSKSVVGKSFRTLGDAEEFYRMYASCIGSGIRRRGIEYYKGREKVSRRRWVCCRAGLRSVKEPLMVEKKRHTRLSSRCNCRASFGVRCVKEDGAYLVVDFSTEHSHPVANQNQVHFFRSHRKIGDTQAMEIQTMKDFGLRTCKIMDYLVTTHGGYNDVGFTVKDLYNFVGTDCKRTQHLDSDAEAAIAYFAALVENDCGLYVRYAVDVDDRLSRIFWADSRSRLDYGLFGDEVVIDSTYKTNRFKMPFVQIVGVNNHDSTTVFGCALVSEESTEAYTWVFRVFLHCMGGKQPNSILSDGDKAIGMSISMVVPAARHRLCSWHLMRNARSVSATPEFLSALKVCMLRHQSEVDFERSWEGLVSHFRLQGNEWLVDMHSRREQWAEPFFKNVFFAGMTTTQRCESAHAYMKVFLNSDLSLYKFVKQCWRSMNRMRENTLSQEFVDSQKEVILRTHLIGLESSAREFYTTAIFKKVQQAIEKECSHTPLRITSENGVTMMELADYGDTGGSLNRLMINQATDRYYCTCEMYESCYLPCSHIFCSLKANNLSSIPASLLNKRWGRSRSTMSLELSKSSSNPSELMFGSLHAKMYQLCNLGSKSDVLYREAMQGICSLVASLQVKSECLDNPGRGCANTPVVIPPLENVVKDPVVAKTKGTQGLSKENNEKSRRCGVCREPGHYKSNCPRLTVGLSFSSSMALNHDYNIVGEDDDDIFVPSEDNSFLD